MPRSWRRRPCDTRLSYSPDGITSTTAPTAHGRGRHLCTSDDFGGTSERIVEDVDCRSRSLQTEPVRVPARQPDRGRNYVMLANLDGSGGKSAGEGRPSRPAGAQFPGVVARRQDNHHRRTVTQDGPHTAVFALDLPDRHLPRRRRQVGVGRRRAVDAGRADVRDQRVGIRARAARIILGGRTLPGGERRRITNDLNSYQGVSVSADASALVTVQRETVSNLWVLPRCRSFAGTASTHGRERLDGLTGLAWTPDSRVVFGSSASGRPEMSYRRPGRLEPTTADQQIRRRP